MKNSREEDVVCSYRKWLLIESVGVSFVQRPLQQNRRRWLTDTSSYLLTLIFGHNQRQPAEVQEEEEMNRFLVSGSCWKRNEMKAKTTVELDKGYFRRAGRQGGTTRSCSGWRGEEAQVEGVQPEEVRPYITFLRADEMDRFLRLGPQYLFRDIPHMYLK